MAHREASHMGRSCGVVEALENHTWIYPRELVFLPLPSPLPKPTVSTFPNKLKPFDSVLYWKCSKAINCCRFLQSCTFHWRFFTQALLPAVVSPRAFTNFLLSNGKRGWWSQSSFSLPQLQRLGRDSDTLQPSVGKSSRCTIAVAKALTVHGPTAPAAFTCPAALHLFSSFPRHVFMARVKQVNVTDKGGPEEATNVSKGSAPTLLDLYGTYSVPFTRRGLKPLSEIWAQPASKEIKGSRWISPREGAGCLQITYVAFTTQIRRCLGRKGCWCFTVYGAALYKSPNQL